MVKKIRGYSQQGLVTTGMGGKKRKRSAPKHRIVIIQGPDGWRWTYYEGTVPRAVSPRSWSKLSDVSRTANTFKSMLANADACSIEPPAYHKYSGG